MESTITGTKHRKASHSEFGSPQVLPYLIWYLLQCLVSRKDQDNVSPKSNNVRSTSRSRGPLPYNIMKTISNKPLPEVISQKSRKIQDFSETEVSWMKGSRQCKNTLTDIVWIDISIVLDEGIEWWYQKVVSKGYIKSLNVSLKSLLRPSSTSASASSFSPNSTPASSHPLH